MSGGRKRILSPFTRSKKRKARNKTREKYMPKEIILQSRGMVERILRR